jgi:glycosyltransferase involved in cell wall biosynthesis
MNIAMVQSTPYPPEEGIGNYVSNLSRQLIDRGHSVSIITRGGLHREVSTDGELRVVRLPYLALYPFHVDIHGVFLDRYLSRAADRFDIVHAHTPLTPPVETSTPLVSTVHSSVAEGVEHVDARFLTTLAHRLTVRLSSQRLVSRQTDVASRVTTVSGRVRDELVDHYGIEGVTVVGNGVDPDRFSPAAGNGGNYVLFMGRLDHPKGIPDLIDAATRVTEHHGVEFVLAGKGPLRDRLEQLVRRRGIDDDVTFTGHVTGDHQLRLYQNATAFVLPSHYEGLPTVLLEAMACGAPVVSTAVGGCPDVIEDGVNGLLVPPGEPEALTDALDTLLSDPELRARFRTEARETVVDRYTWSAVADRFEREYRRARGGA